MVAMTSQYTFCFVFISKKLKSYVVNAYSFIYFPDIFFHLIHMYYFQGSNHPCFFENGPFSCGHDLEILGVLEYAGTI